MTLAEVAIVSRWPKTQRFIARRLAQQIDQQSEPVSVLLRHVANTNDLATRMNLLRGLADGWKGWSRIEQPAGWNQVVAATASTTNEQLSALVRELSVLFGDGRALAEVRGIVLDEQADIGLRRSALEALISQDTAETVRICRSLISDGRLNWIAIDGLVRTNDPAVAEELIKYYRRFRAPYRPRVIQLLCSRPAYAAALLQAIGKGQIPTSDLSAFDVRQIRSLPGANFADEIASVWGNIRETSQAKQQRIASLKHELNGETLATANLAAGRKLFQKRCSTCHRLFGVGESIGPDLTGGNRDNLHYLLENIIDPSAVVSKDFRMTVITTADGRVLNGLVLSQTDDILTLQTQTEKRTIRISEIDDLRKTLLSPMPDGLLDNLSSKQIHDLIGYLMQPTQVPLGG